MEKFRLFEQGISPLKVVTNPTVLGEHGRDESFHPDKKPLGVVFPGTNEEVVKIVAIANQLSMPLIPFGAGTSLEGHVIPVGEAISMDLSRMNNLLSINPLDLDCRLQAGMRLSELNRLAAHEGLFFPVDPGADATLGGMVATRASGTNSVRYGTMLENTLGLTVVTADGRMIQTGGRASKSAAGYDLTRLYCGSEGTLGIITEIQLRLFGIPESVSSLRLSFPEVNCAVDAVTECLQMGLPLVRAEFLDSKLIEAINGFSHLTMPVVPSLWMEFHGTANMVSESWQEALNISKGHGVTEYATAQGQQERDDMWKARHDALYALMSLRPGSQGFVTDVCVPISKLSEQICLANQELGESGLIGSILGHVGDGNFHTCLLVDNKNAAECKKAQNFADVVAKRAIAVGGTCTGEHGIGIGKKHLLAQEQGEAVLVMGAIKKCLDPNGILNPGKMFSLSEW